MSRDIVPHLLHILFWPLLRDTLSRRETRGADRADFRALCAANARLLAKSGGIAILCAGSVVPTGRTRMDDDDFTPRLGRMRSRGKEARYIGLVIKAARRAGKRSRSEARLVGEECVSKGRSRVEA